MSEAAFAELGPLVGIAGACAALGRSRATHYRRLRRDPVGSRPAPPTALAQPERTASLELLHEPRFLDEGTYLGSGSTMDRLLRSAHEVRATGPHRVWSSDSTKRRGPVRGGSCMLLTMLDSCSRCSPGLLVAAAEEGEIVRAWIDDVVATQPGLGVNRISKRSLPEPEGRRTVCSRRESTPSAQRRERGQSPRGAPPTGADEPASGPAPLHRPAQRGTVHRRSGLSN